MGRSHTNPILDMRMYQVEFTGDKVTELTASVIAESIFAECNSEGTEYVRLDAKVDFQEDIKGISLSDQQITVWGRPVTARPLQAGKLLPVERQLHVMGEAV